MAGLAEDPPALGRIGDPMVGRERPGVAAIEDGQRAEAGDGVLQTGRSVLGLAVRQGIPKTVDSSCRPPESVTMTAACEVKARKSR